MLNIIFILVNNYTVPVNKFPENFEREKNTIVTSQKEDFLTSPVGMTTLAVAFFAIVVIIITYVSCWLKKRRNFKTRCRSGKLFVPK